MYKQPLLLIDLTKLYIYMKASKDAEIQLQLFKISSLTNGEVKRSKIGLTEIQLLASIDRVITAKKRWLRAMHICLQQKATMVFDEKRYKVRLDSSVEGIEVVEGKQDASCNQFIELPDLRLDTSIYELQKELVKENTILSRLIYRYGLENVLLELEEVGYVANTPLPWRRICYTQLKADLIYYMDCQSAPIPFHFLGFPRKSTPTESSSLSTSASSSIFSKLDKLQILFLKYFPRSPKTPSPTALTSPYTPLMHYGSLRNDFGLAPTPSYKEFQ